MLLWILDGMMLLLEYVMLYHGYFLVVLLEVYFLRYKRKYILVLCYPACVVLSDVIDFVTGVFLVWVFSIEYVATSPILLGSEHFYLGIVLLDSFKVCP